MGDRQPVPMGLLLRILLDLSIERLIPPWSMAVHSCSAGIFLHYNYGLWNDENSAVQIARAFNYNEVCTSAYCCFKYVHNRFCASSTTTIVRCAIIANAALHLHILSHVWFTPIRRDKYHLQMCSDWIWILIKPETIFPVIFNHHHNWDDGGLWCEWRWHYQTTASLSH